MRMSPTNLMEMSLLLPEGASHPCAHVETLMMSRKERDRLRIMAGVKARELNHVQQGGHFY
jgi:hypothetical protein